MAFIDEERRKALEVIGQKLVDAIRRRLAEEEINASGRLSDSLEYVVTADGLQVLADDYFIYAERGREAGRIPKDFGVILSQWVDAKGISVPSQFKDSLQFGWAIANKIKTYGSLRKRTNNPVDLLDEPIDEITDELAEALSKVFIETILKRRSF